MPFGFGKKTSEAPPASVPAPSQAPVSATIDLGKRTGKISLDKGEKVSIEKTQEIQATVSWKSGTDYDVFALVQFQDGRVETVSQFGTTQRPRDFQTSVAGGAVRHCGDVKRPGKSGVADEQLVIRMTPEIKAVVPVAYSAKSNGTGSFSRYKVSLMIDNGAGDSVEIDARHANNDDNVYSCVPGIIRNTTDGVQIEYLELYSRRGSELRPIVTPEGKVVMDAGPENAYKK
jgi:hypothetical protein